MTRSVHPPSRKHLVAAALGAAAVLSLGMAITAPPAAAQEHEADMHAAQRVDAR